MQIEKKPTHKALILAYLQKHGTITKVQAYTPQINWCMNLPQRIKDLRDDGWLIVSEKPRQKGAHYVVYRLLGRVEEGGPDNDTFR